MISPKNRSALRCFIALSQVDFCILSLGNQTKVADRNFLSTHLLTRSSDEHRV
jgi:hypothetical protein